MKKRNIFAALTILSLIFGVVLVIVAIWYLNNPSLRWKVAMTSAFFCFASVILSNITVKFFPRIK